MERIIIRCTHCNKRIEKNVPIIMLRLEICKLLESHRDKKLNAYKKISSALEEQYIVFHPECFTKETTNKKRLKTWGQNLIVNLALSEL